MNTIFNVSFGHNVIVKMEYIDSYMIKEKSSLLINPTHLHLVMIQKLGKVVGWHLVL